MKKDKKLNDRIEILTTIFDEMKKSSRNSVKLDHIQKLLPLLGRQFIEAQLLHLVAHGYAKVNKAGKAKQHTSISLAQHGIDFCNSLKEGLDTSAYEVDFSAEAIKQHKISNEKQASEPESAKAKTNDEEVEDLLARMRQHEKDWNETPGYADLCNRFMSEVWRRYRLQQSSKGDLPDQNLQKGSTLS